VIAIHPRLGHNILLAQSYFLVVELLAAGDSQHESIFRVRISLSVESTNYTSLNSIKLFCCLFKLLLDLRHIELNSTKYFKLKNRDLGSATLINVAVDVGRLEFYDLNCHRLLN
jgi:hypothetical protein